MENLPQEQRKQRLIQSKPSEKGEIITYLSRMGDVLEIGSYRNESVVALAVNIVGQSDIPDMILREKFLKEKPEVKVVDHVKYIV